MANIKNLKPFKKGEDERRNTLGRPKLTRLTEALREQLAEAMPGASESTIAEEIARVLILEALSGNVQAIREIADRCEGKPKQSIDMDVSVQDWRAIAADAGLTEEEFLYETKLFVDKQLANGFDSE
jgi:hypothetical protein